MGTIVIHAGMPKAGSSSIQHWLAANAASLERKQGVTIAVARDDPSLTLAKYGRAGSVNCQALVLATAQQAKLRPEIPDRLIEELDELASQSSCVVLTSETFAHALTRRDSALAAFLARLSESHDVRVAYYVLPQHTAMEAAWRQWGFRTGNPPSTYLRSRLRLLDYAYTRRLMRSQAPKVNFVVRPLRSDLLDQCDLIVDFAARFLDLSVSPPGTPPVNRGLPLGLVNLLRATSEGDLSWGPHDNRDLNRVKQLFEGMAFEESEEVERGRAVLQAHCHEAFEVGNLTLIEELEWPTPEWVPAPTEPVDGDLDRLDELWAPQASKSERMILYHALSSALAASSDARSSSRARGRRR